MRNTSDLVHEMREEAKTAWLVAIVVGFENETKFVFSSNNQPLEELNRLITRGGAPMGLLRFEKENTTIQGAYRPFQEYEHEPWVTDYLKGLLESAEKIIASANPQV